MASNVKAGKPKQWVDFEVKGKPVLNAIRVPADIPAPIGQAQFKKMITAVDAIKRQKQNKGKTNMPWVMWEGTKCIADTVLPKPGKSGHCYETGIPHACTNATRSSDIYISQELAPCVACIASYSGWAKTIDRHIVVYGEDAHGDVPKQSFVLFTAQGGVYLLDRKDMQAVVG